MNSKTLESALDDAFRRRGVPNPGVKVIVPLHAVPPKQLLSKKPHDLGIIGTDDWYREIRIPMEEIERAAARYPKDPIAFDDAVCEILDREVWLACQSGLKRGESVG